MKENKLIISKLNYNNIKDGWVLPLIMAGIGITSALAGGVDSILDTIKYVSYKNSILEEKHTDNIRRGQFSKH